MLKYKISNYNGGLFSLHLKYFSAWQAVVMSILANSALVKIQNIRVALMAASLPSILNILLCGR